MKPQCTISAECLRELLDYDSDTGIFTWKVNKSRMARIGDVAGTPTPSGYIQICVNKNRIMAHRLAWYLTHGNFPRGMIDHINRIKTDNRISNLRDVSCSENNKNIGLRKDNTSGFRGVKFNKLANKWEAGISKGKTKIYLGLFIDKKSAHDAYIKASIELYPEINGGI